MLSAANNAVMANKTTRPWGASTATGGRNNATKDIRDFRVLIFNGSSVTRQMVVALEGLYVWIVG